jgi:cellulose synthase operon protein C
MLLRFPTLDALRLALTSAVIPREHAQAQVAFAPADDGAIWVDAAEDLPRAAVKELKTWGVESRRGPGELRDRFELATCWLQLVPLVKESAIASGDKTPILFELRRGVDLPELVAEILRLGNDRQSYRHVEAGEESRTLLRVIGPPYYSLLRALGDSAEKPAAFYEQAPRVWVQLGYKHPLASQIQPAVGQMLLLRPLRAWETLVEGAFHEIYQQLEFQLSGIATISPAIWPCSWTFQTGTSSAAASRSLRGRLRQLPHLFLSGCGFSPRPWSSVRVLVKRPPWSC